MSLSITTENMETESWYGSNMSPIDRCGSPESMYCTGNCPFEEGGEPRADVVSVFSKTLCKKQFFFCSFLFFFYSKDFLVFVKGQSKIMGGSSRLINDTSLDQSFEKRSKSQSQRSLNTHQVSFRVFLPIPFFLTKHSPFI